MDQCTPCRPSPRQSPCSTHNTIPISSWQQCKISINRRKDFAKSENENELLSFGSNKNLTSREKVSMHWGDYLWGWGWGWGGGGGGGSWNIFFLGGGGGGGGGGGDCDGYGKFGQVQ